MKLAQQQRALTCAMAAARSVGKIMRDNLHSKKKINLETHHDIKLELDVHSQKRIEQMLRRAFPDIAILGEEGVLGDVQGEYRWVVDPIDGTVNFTYGIPHACVSIALQARSSIFKTKSRPHRLAGPRSTPDYVTVVGVVYDPFCDELWTALRGGPALLNGRPVHVSQRPKLDEAIISLGFAKQSFTLNKMVPLFNRLIHRVRKIRIMGAAALAMVYVATGRMDAYTEYGVRLWDISAGGLILECAGGDFWHRSVEGEHTYHVIANNGLLRRQLQSVFSAS
jgi:myo-inositol-1(or 4)-monophosphatase